MNSIRFVQLRLAPLLLVALLLVLLGWHSNLYALTPSEAAATARQQTGGKVLKVKSNQNGGYRVKVLMPSGQVRNVSVGGGSAPGNDNNQNR